MQDKDKVWIFDTTLRDGEQALKASLTEDDKIQLAHTISRLNVDVMEVGFPVSSPADFRSVQRIATEVKGPIICGLARSVAKDFGTGNGHVFNLGHGITPDVDPENAGVFINAVHELSAKYHK